MKCNIKLKCKMLEGLQPCWWVLLRRSKWDGLGFADWDKHLSHLSLYYSPSTAALWRCCNSYCSVQDELFLKSRRAISIHLLHRWLAAGALPRLRWAWNSLGWIIRTKVEQLGVCVWKLCLLVARKKKKSASSPLFLHQSESFCFFSYLDFSFMISAIDYILCSVISYKVHTSSTTIVVGK